MAINFRPFLAAVTLAAAAVAGGSAVAQASPAVGSWDLTMTTPIGERKSTMTIAPTGGTYTVTFRNAPGADPLDETISDIRIEGNSFAFKRSVGIEQGQIELNYSGTVDGNALIGKVASQFGEFDLKGSRAG
jgi:hypothetical protein